MNSLANMTTAGSQQIETVEVVCASCASPNCIDVGASPDFEYDTCSNIFNFVQCSNCGHVYISNRPAQSELGTIYPDSYGNYEGSRNEALTFKVKNWLDKRSMHKLIKHCEKPPQRILDVGCADGRLLDVCKESIASANALWGVEISEHAAHAAKAKGYEVLIGSIDELELPDGTEPFDLIFLQQVIEHVYDPAKVIKNLSKLLAPGGLLIMATPTVDCLDYKLFTKRYWGGYHTPRHFNLFNEGSLLHLCDEADLKHVNTSYSPQPIHWVWSVHHYLMDKGFPQWCYKPFNIQNTPSMGFFTIVEILAGLVTKRMSNMQVIVRKT